MLEMEAAKEAQISKLRNQVALSTQRDAVRENVEMLRLQKEAKVGVRTEKLSVFKNQRP